jgi:hypothetical protein
MPVAHPDAVEQRLQRRILVGEGLDARQHDAVGDDQRDEDAEHQVQLVQLGVEQQINHRHQRSDDQDEHRDTNFVRDEVSQRSDRDIGDRHDDDRRQRKHDAVDQIGGHGKQRTKAEDLHQARVLVPEPIGANLAEFFTVDQFFSPPLAAARSC